MELMMFDFNSHVKFLRMLKLSNLEEWEERQEAKVVNKRWKVILIPTDDLNSGTR